MIKEYYNTIDEILLSYGKSNVFFVDGMEEFYEKLIKHKDEFNDRRVFYRGQSEAKWICRSSLLRAYLDCRSRDIASDDEGFHQFCTMNREMWKGLFGIDFCIDKFVTIFENHANIDSNKLNILLKGLEEKALPVIKEEYNAQWREVMAQHFGLPTPLIDFTKDLGVALLFATSPSAPICTCGNKDDVNSYFSIIELIGTKESLVDWESVRAENIDNTMNAVKEAMTVCDEDKNVIIGRDCIITTPLETQWNSEDDTSKLNEISHLTYIDQTGNRLISNRRIEKQSGILLCLGKNSHCSLEDAINSLDFADKPIIRCYLIRKELRTTIRALLNLIDVNDDTMGLHSVLK